MILDERTEFCDATALSTAGTSSYVAGDVIDLTAIGADIGQGTDLWCVIQIDTAVAGTSSTVTFKLASDSVPNLVADANATIHFATAAIPEATLVAGYQVAAFRLPLGTYERYLGIITTVGAAALTAGKINAFLTTDVSKIKHYADATN
jgi:acyl CoA:acetate/3-ketoacid CoA transferase alpha subunit